MPEIDIAVGELSRLTGCNIETIRYYERIGLCQSHAGRRAAGFADTTATMWRGSDLFAERGSLASRWTRFARCCGSLVVMASTCGPRRGASLPSTSQASARRLPTSKRWNAS